MSPVFFFSNFGIMYVFLSPDMSFTCSTMIKNNEFSSMLKILRAILALVDHYLNINEVAQSQLYKFSYVVAPCWQSNWLVYTLFFTEMMLMKCKFTYPVIKHSCCRFCYFNIQIHYLNFHEYS